LTFFAPTSNKKRCTTPSTESSDIQFDITRISADHQEHALESALDQPTSVGTVLLPPSDMLMTEKGREECRYLATDIIKVTGLQNQVISPETKLYLIKNPQLRLTSIFLPRQYKDSTVKGGARQQYCSRAFFSLCQLIRRKGQNNSSPIPTTIGKMRGLAKHFNHQYHVIPKQRWRTS